MPFQKIQASGTAVDPPTTTLNFDNATASKSGDVTTLTFAGDISSVVAGAGMTGGGTSGAVTLNVIGDASITVGADVIGLATGVAGAGLTLTAGVLDVVGSSTITAAADTISVASASLVGTQAAVVADANVIGGLLVLHQVTVPDGATGDVDITLTHKTRVIDILVVKTTAAGGASDTITVKNGATAITNAMDLNVADKALVRAGTIDDAQWDIAAAGTLRVTRTKASMANVACIVYVHGIRVA